MTRNFFELFALPQDYLIDAQLLLSRYRDMQRAAHPDRHANSSPLQKRLAVQRSGLINEAYQTLSTPLSRAQHILECMGVQIDMESTGGSQEFLQQQIIENERLQQLQEARDTEGLRQMSGELDARWHDMQKNFASHIAKNNTEAALDMFRNMQFLERMRSRVRATSSENTPT